MSRRLTILGVMVEHGDTKRLECRVITLNQLSSATEHLGITLELLQS
jgi:hypothetical protein